MCLPLGFAKESALGIPFAGVYRVGSFTFVVSFAFSGLYSSSLKVEFEVSLELDAFIDAFCFPAFAFARAFAGPFSCSNFLRSAINAYIS